MNKSGTIQYTEFLASTLEAQGNITRQRIMEAFREVDRSSKGFIDRDDLRKVLPRTVTEKEIDHIMTLVGAQSSGRMSMEQFSNALHTSTRSKMKLTYDDKHKNWNYWDKLILSK